MRRQKRWFGAIVSAVTAVALAVGLAATTGVQTAAAESNGGVKVMPLGDSITDGYTVPGGYRIGLWQRFVSGGYKVDFVGSQSNGPASLGDHDHEGHPGWRIDQIDANVASWLNTYQPHTVLLHIGTNDILQNDDLGNAPNRLSTLIDHITATAPTAEVFVAQIIPLGNSGQNAQVQTYNAAIPGIVSSKVSAGKHVHLVDQYDALTTADLVDGIHPTAGGYDKMAAVWYSALLSVSGSMASRPAARLRRSPAPAPAAAWTCPAPRKPSAPKSSCGTATARPTSSGPPPPRANSASTAATAWTLTAGAPPPAPRWRSGPATARSTSNGGSTPTEPSSACNQGSASTRAGAAPPTAPCCSCGPAAARTTRNGHEARRGSALIQAIGATTT